MIHLKQSRKDDKRQLHITQQARDQESLRGEWHSLCPLIEHRQTAQMEGREANGET